MFDIVNIASKMSFPSLEKDILETTSTLSYHEDSPKCLFRLAYHHKPYHEDFECWTLRRILKGVLQLKLRLRRIRTEISMRRRYGESAHGESAQIWDTSTRIRDTHRTRDTSTRFG